MVTVLEVEGLGGEEVGELTWGGRRGREGREERVGWCWVGGGCFMMVWARCVHCCDQCVVARRRWCDRRVVVSGGCVCGVGCVW